MGPSASAGDVLLPIHISRQWRQVALKIPEPWSYFSFGPENYQVDMDLTKMKRSRIGSQDMTIDVKCPGSHSQSGAAFLKLVIPHSIQWQELRLEVAADLLATLFEIKCRPTNLKLFTLGCNLVDKNVARTVAKILSKSSELRSVTIINSPLESTPLPKSRKYLKSLALSHVDLNVAIDILHNTSRLDMCQMTISAKITCRPSSTVHPSPQTFHVAHTHTLGCDSIIDQFPKERRWKLKLAVGTIQIS